MKLLQGITKGLFRSKAEPLKNNLKGEGSQTKTLISKRFSKEEAAFLFI
jgi:hypothetical protein